MSLLESGHVLSLILSHMAQWTLINGRESESEDLGRKTFLKRVLSEPFIFRLLGLNLLVASIEPILDLWVERERKGRIERERDETSVLLVLFLWEREKDG